MSLPFARADHSLAYRILIWTTVCTCRPDRILPRKHGESNPNSINILTHSPTPSTQTRIYAHALAHMPADTWRSSTGGTERGLRLASEIFFRRRRRCTADELCALRGACTWARAHAKSRSKDGCARTCGRKMQRRTVEVQGREHLVR